MVVIFSNLLKPVIFWLVVIIVSLVKSESPNLMKLKQEQDNKDGHQIHCFVGSLFYFAYLSEQTQK